VTKRVSASEAKTHLSELVAEVVHAGTRVVIEKRGRPVAAIVSMDDFDWLRSTRGTTAFPAGHEEQAEPSLTDEGFDDFVRAVYEERRQGVPPHLRSREALERLLTSKGKGALALVGVWSEASDEEIDSFVREIYEARRADLGREVDLG
jgi:prevent-host-death family protein